MTRIDRVGASAVARWAGPALIATATVVMLWAGWRRWPDVFVDFGWQLYTPWRLASGKVLYTDIAYFSGPLSPYWNSLWFRLFGPGLMILVAVNGVILAGVLVLLYRLLVEISGRLAATTGCLVCVLLFALGQFGYFGNYNFLCPYVHELTHGTLLSIAAISLIGRYQRARRLGAVAAAGVAIGLLELTKAEVFVAGMVAVVTALALVLWVERSPGSRIAVVAGVFAVGVIVPPLAAFWLLSLHMPAQRALLGLLGTWPSLFNRDATSLKFYTDVMGLTHPWESARLMLRWLGSYAVLFVPAIIIAVKLPSPKRYRTSVALLVGVVVAVALWTVHSAVDWANVVQPLPLLLIILLGITLVELIHVRELPSQASPLILRFALCAFGLALLGKMILNSRIVHYGFAHAMPGTVMLVVALVGWIPASITRRGGYGAILQAVAFAAVGVVTLIYVRTSFGMYALKTVPVGSGVDEFFTDARGVFAAATLEQMHDRIAPNQTVAVFPEGVMLNYLARRATNIPYVVFMPLDVNVFGEDRILGALERHPPDFVMLIHKDTSEFGYTYFGRDYAQRLFHWITEHYHPVWQAGPVPLEGDQFGILMLQRITPSG